MPQSVPNRAPLLKIVLVVVLVLGFLDATRRTEDDDEDEHETSIERRASAA